MWINLHSSTQRHPVRPAPFIKDVFSFSIVWFCLLCQKSSFYRCVGLFLGLSFNSIDQSVCFYTNTMQFLSLLLCSKVRDGDTPSCSFIVKNCFHYSVFLAFPDEFENCSFMFLKNCVGILMGIALNL